jgi:glycosyltransferase 2 family protein
LGWDGAAMTLKDYFWTAVGVGAVGVAIWVLIGELRGISIDDVYDSLAAIPLHGWALSLLGAVLAYAAIAGYDHMALNHIGRRMPWLFVTLCSFTTYALSHNIGGSVVSGAVIRFRAYGSRGLSMQEVGILVAFCFITFIIAAALVAGVTFLIEPQIIDRFVDFEGLPVKLSSTTGVFLLGAIVLYVIGSLFGFRPFKLGKFKLEYPRFPIVLRQLTIGPAEIVFAATIFYFALPDVSANPGFIVVLGVFVVAFSLATSTHAPGGLGVFEVVTLTGLTGGPAGMAKADVLAALVVFRLFYYILPLFIALVIVVIFEREQFLARWRKDKAPTAGSVPAERDPA